MMSLMLDTVWELPDTSHLKLNDWYFVTCNHQCWADILILQKIFLRRIPFIRFFIKRELLWLPILNGAWFAYDFPILKRYPRHVLEKNPHLRGKDLEVTKKACQKYQHFPVAILNFLEGTRFTREKHDNQKSDFKNLLNPKIGGLAFALQAMDKRIKKIIDVTIIYPGGVKSFWDFICGRVDKIIVKMDEKDIPLELLSGDYSNDPVYRENFKAWVTHLWQDKDALLSQSTTKF
jgi:1-acyl-sn-glycerol-3-phosphate acyltransferase